MEINGINWKIEYVKPSSHKLQRADGTYTIGVTDNYTKTISINERLNDYMYVKCLTHEITHAVIFSYGVYLDEFTEELIADFMANYGFEVTDLVGVALNNYNYKHSFNFE